jgi:hypothetical protein
MILDIVQLGNYGFKLVVNVKDPDGAVRDLTGASNLKIKIKSTLSTNGKEFTASAENLAQGSISYTVLDGDIDNLGEWKAQAYYELGAWKGHSHPEPAFFVEGNLA